MGHRETYSIGLLEIEDEVQFTHVSKVPVKDLDVAMDDLERDEFVVGVGDRGDEEQGSVTTVNDFRVYLG